MSVQEAYTQWSTIYDTNENPTRDLEGIGGKKLLEKLTFQHILELGCGTGKNSKWLVNKCKKLTAVDFTESMLVIARSKLPNVEFLQADLLNPWHFAQLNSVDLVTFSLVLEHIEDLAPIFTKVNQVLKPGGYVYIGELHPFKQYSGSKACFDKGNGKEVVTCFTHHTSDFINQAFVHGWQLERFEELFDDNNRQRIPRILSMLFRKSTTRLFKMSDETYAFIAEWFDPQAQIARQYLLQYFSDGSLEMIDKKSCKPFLKRIKYPGITKVDLFIGACVTVALLDEYTRDFSVVLQFSLGVPTAFDDVIQNLEKSRLREHVNIVNGSATLFFQPEAFPTTSTFDCCTLCLIRPRVVKDGKVGEVINAILCEEFEISALKLLHVEAGAINEFLAIYKDVTRQYHELVKYMSSGPLIAMEIRGHGDIVERFQSLCGPFDVQIARELAPTSLRARFGKTNIHNGVHCTDCSEDGVLECQYFFRVLE
ncbi:hypothetical protein THRCLA_05590 [Thraustotheca clavata]|uniref:Nucleoside diphosphate kinase n=1 Tax=Thraustotheca clavata TaxID=74557 RepID=A0A1V9ZVG8_9STRA|nr:hypothetical protein THRCLA_05590 [Thraustotheca clavata]